MSTEKEIVIEQRRRLFHLLAVEKFPHKAKEFIRWTKAEMDEEDITYVEKQIAKYIEEQEGES